MEPAARMWENPEKMMGLGKSLVLLLAATLLIHLNNHLWSLLTSKNMMEAENFTKHLLVCEYCELYRVLTVPWGT